MLRRAFTLLAAAWALAACAAAPEPYAYNRPGAILPPAGPRGGPPGGPAGARGGDRVAVLLPLSGPNSEIGQAMLRAVQLAFRDPAAPQLDPRDTRGTPEGAAAAARAAAGEGAGVLLGPLTGPETAAVAPIARAVGLPVLAFTSDTAQGQPGVWTLGITPAQQVRRLVGASQVEGRSRFAAVVPENPFGNALAEGLLASAGPPAPRVERYVGGFPNLNAALKRAADYDNRHGAAEARRRADPDAPRDPVAPGQEGVPPPPLDALLLGATGEQLAQAAPLLAAYDVGPGQVRVLGPALWARDAPRLGALSGAWYAAPDPALRAGFEQLYATTYGAPARELTSLAFDAGGIARAAWDGRGFPVGALVRPEGFMGADGLLGLQPDGGVRRGLAIFEIDRGGSHVVQPAPQSFAAPGA